MGLCKLANSEDPPWVGHGVVLHGDPRFITAKPGQLLWSCVFWDFRKTRAGTTSIFEWSTKSSTRIWPQFAMEELCHHPTVSFVKKNLHNYFIVPTFIFYEMKSPKYCLCIKVLLHYWLITHLWRLNMARTVNHSLIYTVASSSLIKFS